MNRLLTVTRMYSGGRWLVLPGLACPPSSFDDVRTILTAVGADVELVVLDAWHGSYLAGDAAAVLGEDIYEGVVGHSLGGLQALELAMRRPAQVGRILLVDPTPLQDKGPSDAVRQMLDGCVSASLRTRGVRVVLAVLGGAVERWWRPVRVEAGSFRAAGTWERLWREVEVGWDRARRLDAEIGAGVFPVPTLHLVAGRTDRRGRVLQGTLSRKLGTSPVFVAGAGHLAMVDRPERVAQALLWLARQPRGAA